MVRVSDRTSNGPSVRQSLPNENYLLGLTIFTWQNLFSAITEASLLNLWTANVNNQLSLMENLLKISQLPLFYSVLTLLNVLKLESNLFVEQDHIVISINLTIVIKKIYFWSHVLSFFVHLCKSTGCAPNGGDAIGNATTIDISVFSKVASETSNSTSSKTPNAKAITAFTLSNFRCNLTCNNAWAAPWETARS